MLRMGKADRGDRKGRQPVAEGDRNDDDDLHEKDVDAEDPLQ